MKEMSQSSLMKVEGGVQWTRVEYVLVHLYVHVLTTSLFLTVH